jgi:phosphatidylglycerol:prolipoprotein diacylglycerol transferase
MTNLVSFPGLGLEFTIKRDALTIGPLTVYWYGLIVVTGIILGILYAMRRGKAFGLNPDRILDVTRYSVLVGLVGARIYYVAFTWDYYSTHLNEIVRIWEGGIAFYGGVIAGVLCAWLLCRKWKLPFFNLADICLTALLLGQGIGRWGNFVNVEAFGSYYTGVLRMVSPHIDTYFHQNPSLLPGFSAEEVLAMTDIPVHPTFLYESLWLLLGFVVLALYTKHRHFYGEISLLYLAWNGFGRMWIEGLRTDSLMLGSVRISQLIALLLVVVSLVLWVVAMRRVRAGSVPTWMDVHAAPVTEETASAESEQAEESTQDPAQDPTQDPAPTTEIPENAATDAPTAPEEGQKENEDGTDH